MRIHIRSRIGCKVLDRVFSDKFHFTNQEANTREMLSQWALAGTMGLVGTAAAALGTYWTQTTAEQRELHRLKGQIAWERASRLFQPERHPLVQGVELSLYYRCPRRRQSEALTLDDRGTLRTFIRLLEEQDRGQLVDWSFEHLLGRFGDAIPPYTVLHRGELRIRFRDRLDHQFVVVFSDRDRITFPLYGSGDDNAEPRFGFRRTILQAWLKSQGAAEGAEGAEGESRSLPSWLDVTSIVLEHAGPRCDFYRSAPGGAGRTATGDLARMFVDVSGTRGGAYRYLDLIDTFGLSYRYDLVNDVFIDWPHDGRDHLLLAGSSGAGSSADWSGE